MDEFLPVGTVIKIVDKKELYMIIGKFVKKDDVLFDYRCVLYPYGYMGKEDVLDVNNKDIESVYHLGNVNY